MILIDKGITDLVAGYDRIYQAESILHRRWRQPLLLAYSRRRQVFEAELSESRHRSDEFAARFRIGIWLSSILLILGAVALPALILLGELGSLRGPLLCFAPLLILAGLNGWALLAMLWMWQKERKKPVPPPNPLEKRNTTEIFAEWRESFRGELLMNERDEDTSGIYHLIARLLPLDSHAYLLYGLQIDENEQVDVLVVGSWGIWVFEVKNLNGVIRWSEGVWTKSRGVHRLQRDEQVEIARGDQAFESVWSCKAKQVTENIESSIPELIAGNPKVARVRGGLVFTHPQARFVISPGVPFNWGVPKFWIEKLGGIPVVPGFDERTTLRILEALLCRHQELTNPSRLRSLDKQAERLVRQSEDQLKSWIAEV
ncbi:MAG TPA: nuclease-related domain-containing protein [Anaerolineales bacterium]|nr:nuclease-related domain-containing protein [Anaerolineales bacterium]